MKSKSVRFGIAGCGMISDYHAQAIAETEGAVLVGACSKSFSSAEKFAEKHGVILFENYGDMLQSSKIDAVVICTPSGEHFPQAMQAIRAGKDVVVEKPMCLRLEDADALIAEADKLGKKVCVISQSRFSDAAQAIHNAVVKGSFGKMVSASLTMRYFRSQDYYNQAQWRGTVQGDGGGVLMNQGIHGIDLLCYIMGKPQSVCGYTRTALRDIEVEDTASAAVRFENGATAVIDATVCSQPSFGKRFVFCGENGTVILEDDAITLWSLRDPCPIPMGNFSGNSSAADPRGISYAYHKREYENIVAHLSEGAELLLDGRQGRLPLSVILGIYESSARAQVVKL